jgi:hypothetical protein
MQKNVNMLVEMSLVDLVLTTRISCGKREMVVRAAAARPSIVIASMGFLFDGLWLFVSF